MKNFIINSLLVLCSLFLTIITLELLTRIYFNNYSWHNFNEMGRDLFRSAYPSVYDRELGWVPKPGKHEKNVWNTEVTITQDGTRSNGNQASIDNGELILAIGDSFTFGDQVSDHQTWPARLEQLSQVKVINGGVFGYGLDQAILRMEKLANKFNPDIIILSFIPDDIRRCEFSKRTSVPKPYFKISNSGEIVLMNEHVASYSHDDNALPSIRRVFGYSLLAHKLMLAAFPEYWLQGSFENTKVHEKGAEVACHLFKRLNHFAQNFDAQVIVFVQYGKDEFHKKPEYLEKALNCIDQGVVSLMDAGGSLAQLKQYDKQKYADLFTIHMTKQGNDFVADLLWNELSNKIPRQLSRRTDKGG